MPSPQPASLSPSDFAYSRDRFRELAESALATARQLGATDAVVEVSEGVGLSVSVRKGQTENVERNRDKSLSITVFAGQRRGNASTSDYSPAGLEQTVRAAWDIARFTAEDPAAGLPDAETLDWARALADRNAIGVDNDDVRHDLSLLIKRIDDQRTVVAALASGG